MSAKIAVHVTPRSGRDCVSGKKKDDAGLVEVCVRVTAPPDGGKATKQVCKVVADALGCPKSKVSVLRGMTSRHKVLEVSLTQAQVDEWVGSLEEI